MFLLPPSLLSPTPLLELLSQSLLMLHHQQLATDAQVQLTQPRATCARAFAQKSISNLNSALRFERLCSGAALRAATTKTLSFRRARLKTSPFGARLNLKVKTQERQAKVFPVYPIGLQWLALTSKLDAPYLFTVHCMLGTSSGHEAT